MARYVHLKSPWQNGVNESFEEKLPDGSLKREPIISVFEAQVLAHNLQYVYNYIRQQTKLNYSELAYNISNNLNNILNQ